MVLGVALDDAGTAVVPGVSVTPPPDVVPPTGAVVPGAVETGASSQKENSSIHAQRPTHWVVSMIDQHCASCCVVVPGPTVPAWVVPTDDPVVRTAAVVVTPTTADVVPGAVVAAGSVLAAASSHKRNSVFHTQRPTHWEESMISQHACCAVVPGDGVAVVAIGVLPATVPPLVVCEGVDTTTVMVASIDTCSEQWYGNTPASVNV